MSKQPKPESEKKKKMIGIKVTEETHRKLKDIAYYNQTTITELFLKYLPEILDMDNYEEDVRIPVKQHERSRRKRLRISEPDF